MQTVTQSDKDKQLNVVFAGTPAFAVPSLDRLLQCPDVSITAVLTQPDRPAGRGRKTTHSAVKAHALEHHLNLMQPDSLREGSVVADISRLSPDLLIVVAYGLILPERLLAIPTAAINVHASLLPRWRGAAPIQRALIAGDSKTGISIMRVVTELDAGPVWLTRECLIHQTDTAGSLTERLSITGADALLDALELFTHGEVTETPQNEAEATYAHKLTRGDRLINWQRSAADIERIVRAMTPTPGAVAVLGNIEVKLLSARAHPSSSLSPGEVRIEDRASLLVGTIEGDLEIERLQPAGKQAMGVGPFLNGYGNLL